MAYLCNNYFGFIDSGAIKINRSYLIYIFLFDYNILLLNSSEWVISNYTLIFILN